MGDTDGGWSLENATSSVTELVTIVPSRARPPVMMAA